MKIKKITLLATILLTLILNTFSQPSANWQWKKKAEGTLGNCGNSICTDANGYIYVTGTFNSSNISFGSITLTNSSAPNPEIFVVKYDSLGSIIWAKSAGGNSSETINKIYADRNGYIYLTGNFNGSSVSFGGINLTSTAGIFRNFFVAKYDTQGNPIWAKTEGSNNVGVSITADTTGNIYVTGQFSSDELIFGTDTLHNMDNIGNIPTTDIFIVKYDSLGTVIWAKAAGSIGYDVVGGIVADTAGDLYITGYAGNGSIQFGSLAPIDRLFIVKYGQSGNAIWAKEIHAVNVTPTSIALDKYNNIFIAGCYTQLIEFNSNVIFTTSFPSSEMFIAKYSSSHNFVWARRMGITNEMANDLVTDTNGNVFVSGYFSSPQSDFGLPTLTSLGGRDAFISKYSSVGALIWRKGFGGASNDLAQGMAINTNGELYLTGLFSSNTMHFGSDSLISSSIGTGASNFYIAKLFECVGSSSSIMQTACNTFTLNGHTYYSSGIYTPIVANATGCDSVITLNLTINTVNASVSQDGNLLAASDSNAVYQWVNCSNGNVIILGQTGQNYTVTQSGDYAVIITRNGCSDTSECYHISVSDIDENSLTNGVIIYPNPFSSQTTIGFSQEQKGTHLKITDVLGNELKTINFTGKQLILDRKEMSPGIYLLELTDQNHNKVNRKIIIE